MKTTKIKIKNILGIAEQELDGSSIEITGKNGLGKTSIIDAIKYALINDSERDYIVKQGTSEGEILIETDTGLSIHRKKRNGMSDYKKVTENEREINSPESFIRSLFTPLQLDPVAFTLLSRQEQNRMILDLIDYEWDLNWIRDKFGEIPEGVDYSQNILQVLEQIQADNGCYFQKRQDVNRQIRNERAFIGEIADSIPEGYNAEKWENYDIVEMSNKVSQATEYNNKINRAKIFADSYNGKVRGYQADCDLKKSEIKKQFDEKREKLNLDIERKKAEILAAEKEISEMDLHIADKYAVIDSEYSTKVAQLDKDMGVANEYAEKTPIDVSDMVEELNAAKNMIKHLTEYHRMVNLQAHLDTLRTESEELTRKIELARELPSEILAECSIPIEGLTVENGIPLINGLPISNLSEGEKLALCVDVAVSNPNSLQIILIDGTEKLSDENRANLYAKCKEKGLQFIATRTTNDNELEVTTL